MAGNVSFYAGGGIPIGRSFYCLKLGDKYLGIDWGGSYGSFEEEPVYEGPLDWLFLSHGHYDHVGMVPRLVRRYPHLKIFTNQASLALAKIGWYETISLLTQKNKTEFPFVKEDIERTLENVYLVDFYQEIELTERIKIQSIPAGHILGAQSLLVSYDGEYYFFTGDISFHKHQLIDPAPKIFLEKCRVLVREATYINYRPEDENYRENVKKEFVEAVAKVLERKGKVLIPAFATDRLQEIFCILFEAGFSPIYLDGGRQQTKLYLEFLPERADCLKKAFYFQNNLERKKFLEDKGKPGIVISSSGMLYPGSRSSLWALNFLYRKNNALFLVNYQDPGSQGFVIKTAQPGDFVIINKRIVRLECEVKSFDFSSHINGKEGEEMEERINPEIIIYTHGNKEEIENFINSRPDKKIRFIALPGQEIFL